MVNAVGAPTNCAQV